MDTTGTFDSGFVGFGTGMVLKILNHARFKPYMPPPPHHVYNYFLYFLLGYDIQILCSTIISRHFEVGDF